MEDRDGLTCHLSGGVHVLSLWAPGPLAVTGSDEDSHRGCGGAGGFGGGRRGGRVGFGRGGAGAVFWRSQPSRFWRAPRSLIGGFRWLEISTRLRTVRRRGDCFLRTTAASSAHRTAVRRVA